MPAVIEDGPLGLNGGELVGSGKRHLNSRTRPTAPTSQRKKKGIPHELGKTRPKVGSLAAYGLASAGHSRASTQAMGQHTRERSYPCNGHCAKMALVSMRIKPN